MIKKTLILLVIWILISALPVLAIESAFFKFYKTGTSGWTSAGNGEPKTVPPYSVWTCQANTTGVTALTVRVTGNLGTENFPEDNPIAIEECNPNDLGKNVCNFSFVSQPVLRMRIDVVSMTGTSVDDVTCVGIGGLNR